MTEHDPLLPPLAQEAQVFNKAMQENGVPLALLPPNSHPDMPTIDIEAWRSANVDHLVDALAKAQGQIGAAKKDSINPKLGNRYADLAAVWDAIRPALSAAGVAVVQLPSYDLQTKVLNVKTMLCKGDQWISCVIGGQPQIIQSNEGKMVTTPVQAMGSVITYLRRYSLSAMVGVAPDDDDDGNGGRDEDRRQPQTRQQRPPQQQPNRQGRPEQAEKPQEVSASKRAQELQAPPKTEVAREGPADRSPSPAGLYEPIQKLCLELWGAQCPRETIRENLRDLFGPMVDDEQDCIALDGKGYVDLKSCSPQQIDLIETTLQVTLKAKK